MVDEFKWFDLPARLLMASLFLQSGIVKLLDVSGTEAYMRAFGVPSVLMWPAAVWEITSGVMLALGIGTRWVASLLSIWCLLTAVFFHTDFSSPLMQIMFFKNMVMAGGFIAMARSGASGLSMDRWFAQRRAASAMQDTRLTGGR